MDNLNVKWIATLSDGQTAAEHSGEWTIKPGERKPWVRLCEYCKENGLYITSLRLNFNGKTVHMPRFNFDRFALNDLSRNPTHFSVQYHLEVDDLWGAQDAKQFISLTAYFQGYEVHYFSDVADGNNSWVVVTEGYEPPIGSPPHNA